MHKDIFIYRGTRDTLGQVVLVLHEDGDLPGPAIALELVAVVWIAWPGLNRCSPYLRSGLEEERRHDCGAGPGMV